MGFVEQLEVEAFARATSRVQEADASPSSNAFRKHEILVLS
jgi:hypothetical protein